MTYLEKNIFSDNRINAIADKIIFYLTNEFGFDELESKFCLSGSSAFVLQDIGSGPTTNVVFMTSSQDMYDYLAKNVSKITQAKNTIKFKERLLLDFTFIKVEIWMFNTRLSLFEYDTSKIYLQTKATIPLNLL